MKRKKQRLIVTVSAIALIWAAVIIRIFGIPAWAQDFSGNWIRIYPHRSSLEVMLLTVVAALVTLWLWRWYKRDRVRHLLTTLDADEREHLTRLLALEESLSDGGEVIQKRKRQAPQDEDWSDYRYDESSGAQSGGVRG